MQQWGFSGAAAHVIVLAMVVLPLTFVTIVFAELVPKMIALHNNEWVVLRLSPIMRVLSWAVHPVVWITEAVVRAVMKLLPHQGQTPSGRGVNGCTSCGRPWRWRAPRSSSAPRGENRLVGGADVHPSCP